MRQKFFSMEAIDFQSDAFFKRLTGAIQAMWDELGSLPSSKRTRENAIKSDVAQNVLSIVRERFGLKIAYATEKIDEPIIAIATTFFNVNHIFTQNYFRRYAEFFEYAKEESAKHKGKVITVEVDLKKARVGGDLSEEESTLFFTDSYFFHGDNGICEFTAEEFAAILIHEFGHCFTYFEMGARTHTTSLVLDYLTKAKADANAEKIEYAIVYIRNELEANEQQLEALRKAKNDQDVALITYEIMRGYVRSEFGRDIYDNTCCEQMADDFAARMGAGVALMRALDKDGGLVSFKNKTNNGWKWQLATSLIFNAGLLAFMPVLGFLSIGVTFAHIISLCNSPTVHIRYDDAHYRPRRVMQTYIQLLKNKDLGHEEKQTIIRFVNELQKLIDRKGRNDTLDDKIRKLLSASYRKNIDFIQLVRDLEEIGSNKLYVHAAKIHELAREE